MSDTPTLDTSALDLSKLAEAPATKFFISFRYAGLDNGMEKFGYDSQVVTIPDDFKIKGSEEIKLLGDTMVQHVFKNGAKWKDLTVTILSFQKLPL